MSSLKHQRILVNEQLLLIHSLILRIPVASRAHAFHAQQPQHPSSSRLATLVEVIEKQQGFKVWDNTFPRVSLKFGRKYLHDISRTRSWPS